MIQEDKETIILTQTFLAGTTRDFNLTIEFDFSIGGEYQTRVFTIESDPFYYNPVSNDTLYKLIRVNKPVVDLGQDISTVRPDTVILRAFAGVTGYDYRWQNNSVSSTFNVTQWNLYWVKVTDEHGCFSADSVYVYSPFNINELQIFPAKVKIYPNPVQDILHVSVDMETVKNIRLELFDLNSILVYRKEFKQIQTTDDYIYINGFAPGEYFLSFTVDKVSNTYKVIVK